MPCAGCGGKRRATVLTQGKVILGKNEILDGEVTVVYEGPRAGAFTINSKVFPGQKIRVQRNEPFVVNAGDDHIWRLPGMRRLTEEDFAPPPLPFERPKPPEIRVEPPQPPPPVVVVTPPPEPVPQPESKGDGLAALEDIKYLNVDTLKEAGFDSLDKIREDLQHGGVKLRTIKGIGAKTLERITEVALG